MGQLTHAKVVDASLRAQGQPVDEVERPAHYTQHPSGVECFKVVRHMSFCVGSAVKYLWRAGLKGGPEQRLIDLKKARRMIDEEIDRLSAPKPEARAKPEATPEPEPEPEPEVPHADRELPPCWFWKTNRVIARTRPDISAGIDAFGRLIVEPKDAPIPQSVVWALNKQVESQAAKALEQRPPEPPAPGPDLGPDGYCYLVEGGEGWRKFTAQDAAEEWAESNLERYRRARDQIKAEKKALGVGVWVKVAEGRTGSLPGEYLLVDLPGVCRPEMGADDDPG